MNTMSDENQVLKFRTFIEVAFGRNVCILFIFLLTFLGCEEKDEMILPPNNDLTLKEARREIPAFDFMNSASFHTDGKLNQAIQGRVSSSLYDEVKRECIYNENNLLECVMRFNNGQGECYPSMEYINGELTTLNGHPLEYDGNIITEIYPNNVSIKYEFEDDTYQKLTRVEEFFGSFLVRYLIYQFEADHLISIEERLFNDVTGQYELWRLTEYTYDDKRNPYEQAHDQIALVSYYYDMLYTQQSPLNIIYRSPNNVLTETITGSTGSVTTLNYSYEYNAKDYPTRRTLVINQNESVVTYEYYESLD